MNALHFVFLPGTLCDARVFQFQTAAFSGVVVDLRHSATVEDMLALIAAVSFQSFVLVGFSMGGHLAQEFALRFPTRVEKLVILGASSEGYPADEKKLVQSSLGAIERGLFKGITEKRLRDFLDPTSYAKSELRQLIQDMAGRDAKQVYLRQIRATLNRRDLTNEMKSLAIPALFIAGANDQIVPMTSLRRSAENAPLGHFVSLANCGHFVPLEQPQKVNECIRDFTHNL